MDDIKTCPFCGKKPVLLEPDDCCKFWIVSCVHCVSVDIHELTKERAISKWNTRCYPDDVQAAIAKQIPSKVKESVGEYYCRECNYVFLYERPDAWNYKKFDPPRYCPKCGQKADFSLMKKHLKKQGFPYFDED